MFSYVICTAIALVLGLVLATIILGLIMTTKWYTRIAMKITRNVLVSDDYKNMAKEMAKRSTEIAMETIGEVDNVKLHVELPSDEDEA